MINVEESRFNLFENATLAKGSHMSIDAGGCVLEWAAFLAAEPHSDSPACVCPVIGAFLRSWNDALDDDGRQMLKPYAIQILGTRSTKAIEERRAWMATDWLVRTYLPAWLDLAKITEDAAQIRALPEIVSETISATMPALRAAQKNSNAAGDAARNAAGDAAGAAAWAAAWAAARNAAWDALRPTVEMLQFSARSLLNHMIAVK